jgi:hypothetical protein
VLVLAGRLLVPASLGLLLRWIRSVKSAHYLQDRHLANGFSPRLRLLCGDGSTLQSGL